MGINRAEWKIVKDDIAERIAIYAYASDEVVYVELYRYYKFSESFIVKFKVGDENIVEHLKSRSLDAAKEKALNVVLEGLRRKIEALQKRIW